MKQNDPNGGLRRPTRQPTEDITPPRRYRSDRSAAPGSGRERPVQDFYDDLDTFHSVGNGTKKKKRRRGITALWSFAFLLLLAMEGALAVLMAPQLLGHTLTGLPIPSIAFANGSILSFDATTYTAFTTMRDTMDTDRIHKGVSIDGIDVSGMTLAEARATLEASEAQQESDLSVRVTVDGEKYTIKAGEIPMARDLDDRLRVAYARGRTNSTELRVDRKTPLQERFEDEVSLRANGLRLETTLTYDLAELRSRLDAIAQSVEVAPVDATVRSFDLNTRKFSCTS